MATQTPQSKFDTEEITLDFDMLSRLAVGESVATAVVTAAIFAGDDDDVNLTVVGDPTISNNVVSQKISGGIGGNIYVVACSIRSSNNNIYINEAKVAVLTSTAAVPPLS